MNLFKPILLTFVLILSSNFCQGQEEEITESKHSLLLSYNQGNYGFAEIGYGRLSIEERHGTSGLVYSSVEIKLHKNPVYGFKVGMFGGQLLV